MTLAQAAAQVDTSAAVVEDVPSMGTIEVIGQRPASAASPSWLWLMVAAAAVWVLSR